MSSLTERIDEHRKRQEYFDNLSAQITILKLTRDVSSLNAAVNRSERKNLLGLRDALVALLDRIERRLNTTVAEPVKEDTTSGDDSRDPYRP